MYAATLGALGATKKCLTKGQSAEAARLCNCKKYGLPSSPVVKGIGAITSGSSDPCSTALRTSMPSDFNPQDPCEAAARSICPPRLARPSETSTTPTETPPDTAQEYEDEIVKGTVLRQRLMVGGVLAAFLLGAGFLVYRTKKG